MVVSPIGNRFIELIQGDIVEQAVDILVTAANSELKGGGGVDAAIHRAAGAELLAACRKIGGCVTGKAVITPAFNLERQKIRAIIHAVGPIWQGGMHGEAKHLESAYNSSLILAEHARAISLAFPSISTGAYGYPIEPAATIALKTVADFLATEAASLQRICFVLFDVKSYAIYQKALKQLQKSTT